MADKDVKERDVIREVFPRASVLICLFHTCVHSVEKLPVINGNYNGTANYVLASNLDEYNELYTSFSTCPKAVVDYFNLNWHPIKEEWVMGFKAECGSFLNFTNNRLESINGKLKQVISRRSSLQEFIIKFFVILTSLRTECCSY